MHVLTSEAQEEEQDAAGAVRLAIRLSFLANIVLAGLQVSRTANNANASLTTQPSSALRSYLFAIVVLVRYLHRRRFVKLNCPSDAAKA
jgi:hypothetical protein